MMVDLSKQEWVLKLSKQEWVLKNCGRTFASASVELLNNNDGCARATSADKVEETVRKDNFRNVTWKSEDRISVNNRFGMLSETNTETL